MPIGKITKNKWTKNHPDSLRELGYKVDEDSDPRAFLITCEGFVEGKLDLSKNALQVIKQIIKDKKLITYSCRVTVPDRDKAIFRTDVCKWLDKNIRQGASCLVVSKAEGSKGGSGLSDLLDDTPTKKEPSLSDLTDDSEDLSIPPF